MAIIVGFIVIYCRFLVKRMKRMEEKNHLVLKGLEIKWIDEVERKRVQSLAFQLYAEGTVGEAKVLEGTIDPFQSDLNRKQKA